MLFLELIFSDLIGIIRDLDIFNYMHIGFVVAWFVILALPLTYIYLKDELTMTTYAYVIAIFGALLIVGLPQLILGKSYVTDLHVSIPAYMMTIAILRWLIARFRQDNKIQLEIINKKIANTNKG